MMNVCLPVSGLEVTLRQPAGAEDILLLEATAYDTNLALALISSIAANNSAVVWETLSITDLDVLLLYVRQMVFGNLIRADAFCPSKGCGSPIEVAFQIGDYLAHHQPRKARGVKPASEIGWFQFADMSISFRLPSVADQLAVTHKPQPEHELVKRCVSPSDINTRLLTRVERAMAAMAPHLPDFSQAIKNVLHERM